MRLLILLLIQIQEAKRRRAYASNILNHQYTNEEIKDLIQKRSGFNSFLITEYTTAHERLCKQIEKENAEVEVDFELVSKLQKELDKLESGYALQKDKMAIVAAKQVNLNVRNKLANTQNDIVASKNGK